MSASFNAAPANADACAIGDDLLQGASAIAVFLFGPKADRRKVYYAAGSGSFPAFYVGSRLCARKSALLRWIAEREAAGVTGK